MSETGIRDSEIAAEIRNTEVKDWLPEVFLPYAWYTIVNRALLLEDGLKPVNRRILWSLFNKNIGPSSKHLKAARAAGDTMAYHPHGNAAIESALARMAQEFMLRVPLIDAYGQVGKIAGDTPAEARYWECRLTPASIELLKEIKDGAVTMGSNFDGTLEEPERLPSRWPVSIINGTSGIATGYASKMHPHNPTEVMKACIAVARNPELTVDELMEIMPGPDFPSGGEIRGTDEVRSYYETGVGTFTLTGRHTVEELSQGRHRINFFELPYQISPESIIEKVRSLQDAGKLKGIATIKDLSGKKNGLALTIQTKRGTNLPALIGELMTRTAISTKMSTNSTIIVDNLPVVLPMIDQIKQFLERRRALVASKLHNSLDIKGHRMLQIKALLAVRVDLDKAIGIIRNSDDAEVAKSELMREFKLNEMQADYILAMQMRRLTKADEVSLNEEHKELSEELDLIKKTIQDPHLLNERMIKDLEDTLKVIADPRRTVISGLTTDDAKAAEKRLKEAARAESKDVDCFVALTSDGKVLRMADTVATADGSNYSKGLLLSRVKTSTKRQVVLVDSAGMGHKVPVNFISESTPTAIEDLSIASDARVVGLSKVAAGKTDTGLALATKNGLVKISKTDFPNRDSFPVISLDEDDELIAAIWLARTAKGKDFFLVSRAGNALRFDASTVRPSGSKSGGVRGMKLKSEDDAVVGFNVVAPSDNSTIVTASATHVKVTLYDEVPSKGRGGAGVVLHGFRKGEAPALKRALAGDHVEALIERLNRKLLLPPLSRRAAKGNDSGAPVALGFTELADI